MLIEAVASCAVGKPPPTLQTHLKTDKLEDAVDGGRLVTANVFKSNTEFERGNTRCYHGAWHQASAVRAQQQFQL